jgi:serine phosphatase RsbU (regulator of sigma subunit)
VKLRFHRLSHELAAWFLSLSLLPFAAGTWFTYRTGERALRQQVTGNLSAIARRQATRIGTYVDRQSQSIDAVSHLPTVEQAVDEYGRAFGLGLQSREYEAVDRRFRDVLTDLADALGSRDLYLITHPGDVVFSVRRNADLGTNLETGPYRSSAFGAVFDRTDTLLIPEFSDFARYPMDWQPAAFVVAPIARESKLLGAIALRLDDSELQRVVGDYAGLGETGETELAVKSHDKALIVMPRRHDPDGAFVRARPITDPPSSPTQLAVLGYRGQGRHVDYRGKEVLAVWRYVPALNAGLSVKIDAAEAFAPIAHLKLVAMAAGGALVLLVMLAAVSVARALSEPIARLTTMTSRIAAGDLSQRVEVAARNEVGDLAQSFNRMAGQLTEMIAQLTETTRTKERMESELRVAHEIQIGILPKTFPAFPHRPEFDVHALLDSAREVGGDFYDFVLIDDRELYFVIADVSGKGVPASLFMAVTRTLFKAHVKRGIDPAELLAMLNHDLCTDNESGLFCTVFCARLDVQTGELVYSNAGHTPPYRLSASAEVVSLPPQGSLALGMFEEAAFKVDRLTLAPGDAVVLYTDGVTEAEAPDGSFFGSERLVSFLGQQRVTDAKGLVSAVAQEVNVFAAGTPQSDDITMLVLVYRGPGARA